MGLKHGVGGVVIGLLLPVQAQAIFGCEVVADEAGVRDVALYEAPDPASRIVAQIPLGDIVQLPTEHLVSELFEEWSWVQYDPTQEAFWPAGIGGWIRTDRIDYCG